MNTPLLILLSLACAGSANPDTMDTAPGVVGCGQGELFDLVVRGVAVDPEDTPLGGVAVHIEERNWRPGTYGEAVSNKDGTFTVTGEDMPRLKASCWGIGVQFWLVGQTEGLWGDKPLNSQMLEALEAGRGSVDLEFPLYLDATDPDSR